MLARFALVTFVFGLSYMYAITINGLGAFHSVFSWALFVSALILLGLVLVLQSRMSVGTLFSLAVPAVIVGLLVTLFTDLDHAVLFILFNFGYFTYFVFNVALYCGIAREYAVNEVRLASLLVASIFAGLFVGRLLFPAVELAFTQRAQDYQTFVSLAVICVLILCMMVCLRSTYQLFGDFKKSLGFKRIGINEHKALSCEQIAQIFGLSERETEVLQLLLEEKTAAQIAEALVVAPGTAKAHIGNVYKKIDIHRREELFKIAANGLSDTRS
jgi:DNA-binding CsgD family transcriptional regulator